MHGCFFLRGTTCRNLKLETEVFREGTGPDFLGTLTKNIFRVGGYGGAALVQLYQQTMYPAGPNKLFRGSRKRGLETAPHFEGIKWSDSVFRVKTPRLPRHLTPWHPGGRPAGDLPGTVTR
jgi:hypothetical protein